MTERDPTQVELDQVEPEAVAGSEVPVSVQGAVRVQVLPGRIWAPFSRVLDTTPQRVLGVDPRRSVALLVGDGAFKVGSSDAECRAQQGSWPSVTPLPLTHMQEVWVASVTGTVNLFISIETWTE